MSWDAVRTVRSKDSRDADEEGSAVSLEVEIEEQEAVEEDDAVEQNVQRFDFEALVPMTRYSDGHFLMKD